MTAAHRAAVPECEGRLPPLSERPAAPDPFNAAFEMVDGQYYSILHAADGGHDYFPERTVRLYTSATTPVASNPVVERVSFGPAHHQVASVAVLEGLWRQHNMVTWLWTSPAGQTTALTDVVSSEANTLFCSIPYVDFRQFGSWSIECVVNGRFMGHTVCLVKPNEYGSLLRTRMPAV